MHHMEHIWTMVVLKICKHTFYAYFSQIWKLMHFTRFIRKVFATKIMLSGKFSFFLTLVLVHSFISLRIVEPTGSSLSTASVSCVWVRFSISFSVLKAGLVDLWKWRVWVKQKEEALLKVILDMTLISKVACCQVSKTLCWLWFRLYQEWNRDTHTADSMKTLPQKNWVDIEAPTIQSNLEL